MVDVRELGERELDALREVANIGAGHAATALSQMVDCRVMISVPKITVATLEHLPNLHGDPNDDVAAVLMHMLGDLTGRTLLLLPKDNAQLLCDLLLRQDPGTTNAFEELQRSALKEAGNILAGAHMGALSDFMGMMLLPSVPSLVVDRAGAVLTTTQLGFGQSHDCAFCVETDFHFEQADRKLKGHFLLFPDESSLQAILEAFKLG
jgi:chemotaxis protein CheC